MARILGFHPRGPGSIPGVGDHFFQKKVLHFIKVNTNHHIQNNLYKNATPNFGYFEHHDVFLLDVTRKIN